MKLYAIYLYHKKNGDFQKIDSASDFSDITLLARGKASEFCEFFSYEITRQPSEYKTYVIDHEGYRFSVCRLYEDICVVATTTSDYSEKASIIVCKKVADEFYSNNYELPGGRSKEIHEGIVRYQDVKNVDQLAGIQETLKQTEEIMLTNLEKAFGRREKLDELVKKSEILSDSSKNYFRKTKDLNKCSCSLI